MKHSLGTVTVAALGLASLPALAQAQEGPVWDVYGQLNFGVLSVDDGEDTNTTFIDNDNSNSRVGLTMTQALNDSLAKRIVDKPGQWFWVHRRWRPE